MNLRKAARGRECQIRLRVCNGDTDTVVLAHLPGGGMGRKQHDLLGAWACSSCHDVVDGRAALPLPKELLDLMFLEGVIRTQAILLEEGLILI